MQLEAGNKVLVFAGTTEGRKIAECLNKRTDIEIHVSAATEYGASLLSELENVRVHCGRMDEHQIKDFLRQYGVSLVIDATHPFAVLVTENIKRACEMEQIPYLRCLREEGQYEEEAVVTVESVEKAVEYLEGTTGKILIATGSKELDKYTRLSGYRERCYARVLSTMDSVKKTIALGFEGAHLIAMQGPFSRELNAAMLRQLGAEWFVTKESGGSGGFQEKLDAARETGAGLVVVGRPKETGYSVEEICTMLLR